MMKTTATSPSEFSDPSPNLMLLALNAEAECQRLRQENQWLRTKAESYDRLADCADSFSLADTAKLLKVKGLGRNGLIRFLRGERLISANNVALQRYIDRGYFRVVQAEFFDGDGSPRVKAVTRVQEKGIHFIRQRLDAFLVSLLERRP